MKMKRKLISNVSALNLVFSVLAVFVHNATLSVIGGRWGCMLGWRWVAEFVVVVTYVVLRWVLEKVEVQKREDEAVENVEQRSEFWPNKQ